MAPTPPVVTEDFRTEHPVTGLPFIVKWGLCWNCEQERLLYKHLVGQTMMCGACCPLDERETRTP